MVTQPTSQVPKQTTPPPLHRIMYDGGELSLFPQLFGVGGEVVDFWSTLFPGAAAQHDDYEQLVRRTLHQSGLASKPEPVSFAQGVILGKSRPFYVVRRGSVTGTIHIGKVGPDLDDIYVSLRVLFVGAVSRLKSLAVSFLLLVAAAFPALLFFIPVWGSMGFMTNSYTCSVGNCYVSGQTLDTHAGLMAYLGTLVVLWMILSVACYLWSWWRYGDGEALVREDLDELYRDDLSALGYELYAILNTSADALDFKRLSEDAPISPSFGTTAFTNRTRKRRI